MPRPRDYPFRRPAALRATDSDARYDLRFIERRHLSLAEAVIYTALPLEALRGILRNSSIPHRDITPKLLDDLLSRPQFAAHRRQQGIEFTRVADYGRDCVLDTSP